METSQDPQPTTSPMTVSPVTVMESNGETNGNGNGMEMPTHNGNGNGNGHADRTIKPNATKAGVIAAQSIGTGVTLSTCTIATLI